MSHSLIEFLLLTFHFPFPRRLAALYQRNSSHPENIHLVKFVLRIIPFLHHDLVASYGCSNQDPAGKKLLSLWDAMALAFDMFGGAFSVSGSLFPNDVCQSTLEVFSSLHFSSHLYNMYALLLKLVHFDIGSKESNGRLSIQGPACRRSIYVAVRLMGLTTMPFGFVENTVYSFFGGLLDLLFPLANIVFSNFFSFYSCLLDCVHVVLTNIKCPVSDHVSWFLVAFYRLIRI